MMNVPKNTIKSAVIGLTVALTAGTAGMLIPAPQPTAAAAAVNQKVTSYLEHPAFKQAGQLYVPLREAASLFDLHLVYHDSSKILELTGVTQTAKLKAGSSTATGSNGASVSLGAPVQLKQGVTYVPASLFGKLFGIPISLTSKHEISYVYSSKYALAQTEGMLFWLNRSQGVLYMGPSGRLPSKTGTVEIKYPDLLGMTASKIDDSSYVADISNVYGEPHIFNGRYRALVHGGAVVRQSGMSFGGPSSVTLERDVLQFDGSIVLNNGATAELVKPDGTVVETLDLEKYGGPDDVYSLEALDSDFLLIRSYAAGTLLLVNRGSGKTTPLYLSLLDQAGIDRIENDELGINDGLKYAGRSGNQLKFTWQLAGSGAKPVTKTYDLTK
ncbi:copper amine oxidase N-terminal domain-containing protein [Paenibacillus sp. DYY-L-2]|uniref:copper amine oxidase N-terminal domain-containing protein n=1 Tax=Paenibacillus sp. DYY-L-2 TaxID=3447013 RepID=UPI003F4F6E5A